jgi:hypothetical protein
VSAWPPPDSDITPDDESNATSYGFRLPAGPERTAALRDPGPSWKEWLYGEAIKWWLGIVLLIVDSWIAVGWAEAGGWLELGASLVAALYLEFLLYQYLWHPYDPSRRGAFRPSWRRPFEVGRWSPDRPQVLEAARRGLRGDEPDPRHFL